MIYYISGPMRGFKDLNARAFNQVEEQLIAEGYEVFNPIKNPVGLTPAQYMDIDLAVLRCCTGIVMLPSWEASKGCAVELAYARYLDLLLMKARFETTPMKYTFERLL